MLCGSLLIHLRDPILALERLAALCRGEFVLAEERCRRLGLRGRQPVAEFHGAGPHMTWWVPTTGGWLAMARAAGFAEVRHHGDFTLRFRGRRSGVPHTVIHAQGTAGTN